MMDLIRQEEGRGGKRIEKFTHKVKHLTSSSRSIFNDKYASLMRKIDENSRTSSSGSRSLSSVTFFPTKNVNIRSESNSMLDIRKPKSWTHSAPKSYGKNLQRTAHPIVRSVSDDSSMKQPSPSFNTLIHKPCLKSHRLSSETSVSTQSSPDVCSTEQCSCSLQQSLNMPSYLEMHKIILNLGSLNKMETNNKNSNTRIVKSLNQQCSNSSTDQVI